MTWPPGSRLPAVVVAMVALAAAESRAQPNLGVWTAGRFITREIVVFPRDPGQSDALARRLRGEGFLIPGQAPTSGMILAAVAVPGIEWLCCEWLKTWPEVRAAEGNLAGEHFGRQPTVCPPSVPFTNGYCTLPYPYDRVPACSAAPAGQPNDPAWCYQWGLHNTGQTVVDLSLWYPGAGASACWEELNAIPGIDINVLEAWEHTTGSSAVTVAVIDGGIEYCNPDFDPSRFLYPDIALTCPGDDRTTYPCYTTDPPDFGLATDNSGRGTLVASIIGAVTGNDLGIAGIDQACRILSVRAITNNEYIGNVYLGNAGRLLIALDRIAIWPEYESVRVINASFGIPYVPPNPLPNAQMVELELAVAGLAADGRFIVAASGNDGGSTDAWVPQRFVDAITVGGIDSRGWLFDHPLVSPQSPLRSSTGPSMDLVAPAVGEVGLICQRPDCTPTSPPSPGCPYQLFGCYYPTFNFVTGTSFAAPKVSAAISLILGRAVELNIVDPNNGWAGLTWDDMYEILQAGARDQVSYVQTDPGDPNDTVGWDESYGWGLIDIAASLVYLEQNLCCP